MRIEDRGGIEITTLDEWRLRFFATPSRAVQWREGRSAHTLAGFVLNMDGGAELETLFSSALGRKVVLESTQPEFSSRFDEYRGMPAVLDLGGGGVAAPDSSLFFGVEAKVDEPFGEHTVAEHYEYGLSLSRPTNIPRRVEDLLSAYFSDESDPRFSRFSGVSYQLLTAAAGTAAAGADVRILCVLVFKTTLYDEGKGEENRREYLRFIEAVWGRSIAVQDAEAAAHELTVVGKGLLSIYREINLA